jgi:hypothetical protein
MDSFHLGRQVLPPVIGLVSSGASGTISSGGSGTISSTVMTTEQFKGLITFVVASWTALFTVAVTMVTIYAMKVLTRCQFQEHFEIFLYL